VVLTGANPGVAGAHTHVHPHAHVHPMAAHTHDLQAHTHDYNHNHTMSAHQHAFDSPGGTTTNDGNHGHGMGASTGGPSSTESKGDCDNDQCAVPTGGHGHPLGAGTSGDGDHSHDFDPPAGVSAGPNVADTGFWQNVGAGNASPNSTGGQSAANTLAESVTDTTATSSWPPYTVVTYCVSP
jgi:hypothetical protein